MFHICFTNPEAWLISKSIGVYGNVFDKDLQLKTQWGILVDLLAIRRDDIVFFFIKNESMLTGLYRVTSNPYFCQDLTFKNPAQSYPYRFDFVEEIAFENNVPVAELAKLIQVGKLFSLATFERDANASFRGIRQITTEEADELTDLFIKYNPKIDSTKKSFPQRTVKRASIEANDLISRIENEKQVNKPLEVTFNSIAITTSGKKFIARFENVIQGFVYVEIRKKNQAILDALNINGIDECLLEFPLLKAQQFRADILCLYRFQKGKPHFYSIIEFKRDKKITIEDLAQLIGYMKSFAEAKQIEFNRVEGIYISTDFESKTIEYLNNRKSVEKENPVRLIRYATNKSGQLTFIEVTN